MTLTRDELCSLWPKLDRPLALLEKWENPCGIIFESDPESAHEAVTSVAAILGGHIEKFESHPILKEDWQERAGVYLEGGIPPAGLYDAKKDRLTIVILDLDQQPEWLQLRTKGPMDRADPPMRSVCFLATSTNAEAIPDYVRTCYFVVRKTGRRRGPLE